MAAGPKRQSGWKTARLEEIDLARGAIVLPPERTRNRRTHELPLSDSAMAILAAQPRRGPFVFGNGRRYANWSDPKAALDSRAGLTGWRLHDLRRTAATRMAELGTLPHVIEAVLNHVSGHRAGVAGIYNRATYAKEMREALERLNLGETQRVPLAKKATERDLVTPHGPLCAALVRSWGVITLLCELCPNGKLLKP